MMVSVEEAVALILDGARPLGAEPVGVGALTGRIAARDVVAQLTQPPHDASAMDGYAVRFEDAEKGAPLTVIGEAPAGAPFAGEVGENEAVRVFTGSVIPRGATHVIIQEDVERRGDRIFLMEEQQKPKNIRAAGLDFRKGDILEEKGAVLHEFHGALFAAANMKSVSVFGRPLVALFSNGDELVEPGETPEPGQIVNANHFAVAAMIENWGAAPRYLGCAPDDKAAVAAMFDQSRRAHIAISIGGASVGDYDFVKPAFAECGGDIIFDKVSVKPGKPAWFGKLDATFVLGLPGNPASAIVTTALLVRPLVRRLAGAESPRQAYLHGVLTQPLRANGARESYLRATASPAPSGVWQATPAANQDSSLLSPFASANVLIRRPAHAPAAAVGDRVDLVHLR
jgi:molybdopterin molybdotransferase